MRPFTRAGPIACTVDAEPLHNYTGGVIADAGKGTNHIISIIGASTSTNHGFPTTDRPINDHATI